MTNTELAELRGELVGLKVILANLLAFQAGNTDNPLGHLTHLKETSMAGLSEIGDPRVRPAHRDTLRAAAAGIVLQMTEAASAVFPQGKPRPQLQ